MTYQDSGETKYPTAVQAAAGNYQKALFLKSKRQYSEAIDYLRLAIKLNPWDMNYPIEIAYCYLHLKQPREALDILAPLYKKNPQDSNILKPYCYALLELGRLFEVNNLLESSAPLIEKDIVLQQLQEKVKSLI